MTAASNSEACKREAEALAAQDAHSTAVAPVSSSVAPESTASTNGAQGANLALACSCGHEVQWHHETRGCGYHGFSERDRCRCRLTSSGVVAAIVREHRAEVLAEVERRIEALPCPGSPPAPLAKYAFDTAIDHATEVIRDYRQEQNR